MARLAPESRLSLLDDRRVLGLEPGLFWHLGRSGSWGSAWVGFTAHALVLPRCLTYKPWLIPTIHCVSSVIDLTKDYFITPCIISPLAI